MAYSTTLLGAINAENGDCLRNAQDTVTESYLCNNQIQTNFIERLLYIIYNAFFRLGVNRLFIIFQRRVFLPCNDAWPIKNNTSQTRISGNTF